MMVVGPISGHGSQRELHKVWAHTGAMVGIAVFSVVALSVHTRTITDLAAALATAIWVGIFVSSPGKYERLMPLATILGILALAFGTLVVFQSGTPRNDFLQFYVGAGTLGAHDFYGTAAAQATRESLSQDQFPMAFVRLPFFAWLLRPLTRLSYHTAYVIWQTSSGRQFLCGRPSATPSSPSSSSCFRLEYTLRSRLGPWPRHRLHPA
jgi:hypothetical protein